MLILKKWFNVQFFLIFFASSLTSAPKFINKMLRYFHRNQASTRENQATTRENMTKLITMIFVRELLIQIKDLNNKLYDLYEDNKILLYKITDNELDYNSSLERILDNQKSQEAFLNEIIKRANVFQNLMQASEPSVRTEYALDEIEENFRKTILLHERRSRFLRESLERTIIFLAKREKIQIARKEEQIARKEMQTANEIFNKIKGLRADFLKLNKLYNLIREWANGSAHETDSLAEKLLDNLNLMEAIFDKIITAAKELQNLIQSFSPRGKELCSLQEEYLVEEIPELKESLLSTKNRVEDIIKSLEKEEQEQSEDT